MIITTIKGGLGNQMFQYAFGLNLAIKHKTNLKLYIPNNKIENIRNSNSFLFIKKNLLSILKYIHFSNNKIQQIDYFTNYPRNFQLKEFVETYNYIISEKEVENLIKLKKFKQITEKQFNFDTILFNSPDDVILDGFWQSEKYFKNISSIIKDTFKLKNKITNRLTFKIQNTESISIHIRRGDYSVVKENRNFGILSIDYYKKAVDLICSKVSNPVFFVFSDDLNWIEKHIEEITGKQNRFIIKGNTGKKSYIDLYLMTLCKHNIVANSSFSWWAAYLNTNHQKIVIAPEIPFIGDYYSNYQDYYPENWIKI